MERKYAIIVRVTLVVLYLVFLAGSIVRMSGSGMGCPDWPKCFGHYVPPTDISQLPENYKEIYSEKRAKKIERFSSMLDAVGLNGEADKLRNDKSLLEEQDFNAQKTWTEYVNRLVGALSGLFVLIGLILSLWFYRTNPKWFYISLFNLIVIVITAWFGAIVVATNLMPWVLTVHMLLGLVLVLSQINLIVCVVRPKFKIKVGRGFRFLMFLSVFLMLVQILLGTQVRQNIDVIADEVGQLYRHDWINHTNIYFYIHRSFSIALVLVMLWTMYLNLKYRYNMSLLNLTFLILCIEVILGMVLNYLGMPAFAQPMHLMVGTLLIGLQYYIYQRTVTK